MMVATLTVERAGPTTTIQDAGRFGLLRFGVTPAGPMDWTAFETANRALGNPPGAAAIEIGAGGLSLSTDCRVLLAFCGGGFAWRRGERALPPAARILLRPGEMLTARPGAWGTFAYCAVPGGIDVAPVLGSRATHTRSALGGLEGRALTRGDRLRGGQPHPDLDDAALTASWLDRSDAPIRVVLGPQDDCFTEDAVSTLLESAYQLTSVADRMAYVFKGPELTHRKGYDIVSDGVALGAIQVAGDGQPMILMADRQPTGGYTKLAHVCRADIGRLAQMRAGETCRFVAVDAAAARTTLLAVQAVVDAGARTSPLRVLPTAAALLAENLTGGIVP